ncbi:3D domain-containing protein [Sporomusa acidovorans]|uniref:G5 domain-containing protein n=1 Tax=Sporomusa acidovorans (strain ATCC 49682 / DSM 3132 / Mol) TaxID=1123286 RepID=A0ABZ3IW15_SPOA4|nr:3D domain-containing protein [Sporomusa acidovorans]OZC14006.1 cell wall-binding protein YocH precursor [Sporomusa acidovorans DSM 3132]SDF22236.1 3D (Asp-Asp-Asp) domain-containing protein [Sporomusa acidovorans]
MSDERSILAKYGQRKVVLIVALLLASLVATGFVWAHKQVHIIADGQNYTVNTLYQNPHKILHQAGIELSPEDEIRLSTTNVVEGTVIEVLRAVPVTIIYQGKSTNLIAAKATVREIADLVGIPHDKVKLVPGDDTKPDANMTIRAITLSEKIEEQEIPDLYQVIRQPDSTLEKGVEETVQTGENGLKKATVRVKFEDGVKVSADVLSEIVAVSAKPQIIRVGTRNVVETSRGTMRFRDVRHMEASAYLPTDGSSQGLTATGIAARHGIVAVDPDVIPLGTRLYIPGYGMGLAADTGGAIIGNRIDLCMESSGDAWRFGRRTVKVYILDE